MLFRIPLMGNALLRLYNSRCEVWQDSGMKSGCSSRVLTVLLVAVLVLQVCDARAAEPSRRVVHKESGIALMLVPAGEFLMGSPESERERIRDRRHKRIIRQAFYLGETEVTVGQFRKFVEATSYQTDAERGTGEQGKDRLRRRRMAIGRGT